MRLKTMLIESLNLEMEPNEIAEDSSLFGIGIGLDFDPTRWSSSLALKMRSTYRFLTDEPHLYRSINTIADFVESQLAGK